MWYFFILLLTVASTSAAYSLRENENVVYLVRIPQIEDSESNSEFFYPRDIFPKRATMPFNGGMYGKRSMMPFNGGMYGKRSGAFSSSPIFAHRRASASSTLPFSGGMYGKRSSASAMFSPSSNDVQIKRGAMPFSGGMYGR